MNLFKKFFATYKAAQYDRTAKRLLAFSDEKLNNIGLSRELLQQGHQAFPWRIVKDQADYQDVPTELTTLKAANQGKQSFSMAS